MNLCDECKQDFATCNGKPVFKVDVDSGAEGSDADAVVECPQFVKEDE